jgi:hypothetical protein
MSDRLINLRVLATIVAFIMLIQVPGAAQTQRTEWGDPNLQGVYTFATPTPLERPEALGSKGTYTDAELAELEAQVARRNAPRVGPPEGPAPETYDRFWVAGEQGRRTDRTSLIIDPPDGRIPPLTPEAASLLAAREAEIDSRQVSRVGSDGEVTLDTVHTTWMDLSAYHRCVARPVPRIGAVSNHGIQIIQTPGYVVLHYESMHDARIIPLDGRPTLDASIRQWNGNSRGHWEGNTLVVYLTNMTDEQTFRADRETMLSMGDMEFVERLTRINENTIQYEVTVNDPTTWTAPWTFIELWRGDEQHFQLPEHLYEYACHEGNFRMMEGTLKGSRTLLEQVQD